jgi:hypothetical protein
VKQNALLDVSFQAMPALWLTPLKVSPMFPVSFVTYVPGLNPRKSLTEFFEKPVSHIKAPIK